MSIADVLQEKGIELPPVVVPVANYMLASRSGKVVTSSGFTPKPQRPVPRRPSHSPGADRYVCGQ